MGGQGPAVNSGRFVIPGFRGSAMAATQAGRTVSLFTHPVTSLLITLTLLGEAVTAFSGFLLNYAGLYLPPLLTLAIGAPAAELWDGAQ